ncbi:MAG: 23S rRNA (pseudouridine(1915)-N(3))-methyltransferase RlmH [Candidatus Wallbacteria bacterium]|nr:23S rRNA (pseudouridine(1915)-N(3))-methyltransferase RlmH [Candidatus Wallbacteria bacterium]
MKIQILAVGSVKSGEIRSLIFEYLKRLKPYQDVQITELKEGIPRKGSSAKKEDEEKILSHLKGRPALIALSEEGKAVGSLDLALLIKRHSEAGTDICFIIGGTEGLSDTIKKSALFCLSLSDLTFTREMARLILVEQLYRAVKINRGEPYHR